MSTIRIPEWLINKDINGFVKKLNKNYNNVLISLTPYYEEKRVDTTYNAGSGGGVPGGGGDTPQN